MGYIEDIAHLLADMDYTLERGKESTKNGLDLIQQAQNLIYPIIDTELIARNPTDLLFNNSDYCLYLYNQHHNRVGSVTADIDTQGYYGQIRIRLYGQMYASRFVELDDLKAELDKLLSTLCIRIVKK